MEGPIIARCLHSIGTVISVRAIVFDLDGTLFDRLFREGFLAGYREAWTGFDDVDEGLAALRNLGFNFAILTNGAGQQQRDKLAHLGLLDRVGPISTAEGLGMAEPSAQAFHTVCRALGLRPTRCCMSATTTPRTSLHLLRPACTRSTSTSTHMVSCQRWTGSQQSPNCRRS